MMDMAWMAAEKPAKAYFQGLIRLIKTLAWIEHQASRVPVAGGLKNRATDKLLDSIFGPAEDYDYVSTTAPASPPPPFE